MSREISQEAARELYEATRYTLGVLVADDKYQNDDVLWSCVSQLTRALRKATGKPESDAAL